MMNSRLLVLGCRGQVGRLLVQRAIAQGVVFEAFDLPELDIKDEAAIDRTVAAFAPTHILNAAAYNAVDRAEDEPEAAFSTNAIGPARLALAARRVGAALVHYSSDYVFDGRTTNGFVEEDHPHPLSTYGQSKLLGDRAVEAIWERTYILRTAWVFAPGGNNFVSRLIALADRGVPLRFVDDQWGTPTYAADLVDATFALLLREAPFGLYHAVGSRVCTPFEWARSALAIARPDTSVTPVPATAFSTRAPRPQRSILRNARLMALGIAMPDGLARLSDYFETPEAP